MEKFMQNYQNLLKKVEDLEKKTAIVFNLEGNAETLLKLSSDCQNTKKILVELKGDEGSLTTRIQKIKERYENVKHKLALQQFQMIFLLNAMESVSVAAPVPVEVQKIKEQAPKPSSAQVLRQKVEPNTPDIKQSGFQTPRMSVSQYGMSPFVHRKRGIQLQFIDFEVEITQEDYKSIPHYMKGRETLEDLHAFIANIFVPTFTEKYTLIHKKRDAITNAQELEIWNMFKQQESYFPNLHFITEGDISRRIGRLVDKKMQNKVQMLRHLGIVREVHKNKAVYYIWVKGT